MVNKEGENWLMLIIVFFLGALLFWLWVMREERNAEESAKESLDAAEETLKRLEDKAAVDKVPPAPKASEESPKAVEKAPAPEAPILKPVAENSGEPDDLTQVNGIGPKSAEILAAAGIDSFAKLAAMSEDEIIETIQNGGGRKLASMNTWAEQAKALAKK